jgi:hypothetical protein
MFFCGLKEYLQLLDLARYLTDIALSMIFICGSFSLILTTHNKILPYIVIEYNNFC